MCAHLKKVLVKENELVKQNQVIGLCGKTGKATGAHLHFSMWLNDELIDPFNFVDLPFTDEVKQEYVMRGINID